MFRKIIMLAVASGLAARAYRAFAHRRDAGAGDDGALRVWEDEGGTPPATPQV